MPVEPITDLRRDIGEEERLIHSLLRDLRISCRHPNTIGMSALRNVIYVASYMWPRSYPLRK